MQVCESVREEERSVGFSQTVPRLKSSWMQLKSDFICGPLTPFLVKVVRLFGELFKGPPSSVVIRIIIIMATVVSSLLFTALNDEISTSLQTHRLVSCK